jgi:WD40 repeat protein
MAFKFLQTLGADDIFISYTRLDASTYAAGLADELTKLGFSCFIDRLGTDPNKDLPDTLRRKIRGCSMLVVVGTERAAGRETIEQEIREFLSTGRTSIVPVNFGDAVYGARWYPLVEGIAPEPEPSPTALDDGDPSDSVISRIEKQFKYRRRDERLRRTTRRAVAVLALLLIAIAVAAFVAWQQLERAATATAKANAETERAALATRDAKAAQDEARKSKEAADAAKDEADRAKDDASKQKDIADRATEDAKEKTRLADEATRKAQEATARAAAEQARAEREQARAERQATVAQSRALANQSQTALRQRPEDVLGSLKYAVDSMQKSASIDVHAIEADTALRESLALFPRRRTSHTYTEGDAADAVTATALSPDGRHFASVSGDKLNVYESGAEKPFKVLDCDCGEIALSNGASLAAAVKAGGGVEIFDLKAGSSRPFPAASADRAKHLALSPGGRYLAVTAELDEGEGQHSKLSVFDLSKKDEPTVKTFDDYDASPGDRNPGASEGESEGGARAAGATTGGCDETLNMSINDVAFGPSGNLAVAGEDKSPKGFRVVGRVVIWPLELYAEGGPEERTLEGFHFDGPLRIQQQEVVQAVAPGTDATYFATDVGVWKMFAGGSEFEPVARMPRPLVPPLTSTIKKLAFGPDGKSLTLLRRVVTNEQNSNDDNAEILEEWDSVGHRDSASVLLKPDELGTLGFKPGAEAVALLPEEPAGGHSAAVFSAADGRKAEPVTFEAAAREGKAHATSQSADFIISADDKTAEVWDVWAKRRLTATLDGAQQGVGAAAVSAGGKFFALVGEEESGDSVVIYRREGDSYRSWKSIKGGDDDELGDPVSVSLSADGRRVAVHYTYGEEFARVWDVRDEGDPVDASPDSLKAASSVRSLDMLLSPDGRFLVTTDVDGLTQLLDLSGGKNAKLETLLDSTTITARAFSADGRYLGLGSDKGILYVFDTKSTLDSKEIARLQHTGSVEGVAFSDDGKYVATTGNAQNRFDPTESYPLRVWLLRPEDLLAQAKARADSLDAEEH